MAGGRANKKRIGDTRPRAAVAGPRRNAAGRRNYVTAGCTPLQSVTAERAPARSKGHGHQNALEKVPAAGCGGRNAGAGRLRGGAGVRRRLLRAAPGCGGAPERGLLLRRPALLRPPSLALAEARAASAPSAEGP